MSLNLCTDLIIEAQIQMQMNIESGGKHEMNFNLCTDLIKGWVYNLVDEMK